MGLIMVIGIVAKNGILLLDANQRFLDFGFEPEEAMIQAGRRRLRPIVMNGYGGCSGDVPTCLGPGCRLTNAPAIGHRGSSAAF